MPKECANEHCIDTEWVISMKGVVGVCPCGNKFIVEKVIAIYEKDIYNELEELFHVYKYLVPFHCHGCGRFLRNHIIVCDENVDANKILEDARKDGVMHSGFFKN